MKKKSVKRIKFKRTKTLEEIKVERTIVISIFPAMALFVACLYLNLITSFIHYLHKISGAIGFYSGHVVLIFGFHALFNVLFAWLHRFSRRQFKMLAKLMLGLDIGLPLALMGYGYLILGGPFISLIREFHGAGMLLVTLMNVLLFGLVALLKKLFGARVYDWVQIDYFTDKASLDEAIKSVKKAEIKLKKRDFVRAHEDFHLAASIFTNLEHWNKAAENYWKAADALSNKRGNNSATFHVAWLYGLSALSSLLSDDVKGAREAVKRGRAALDSWKFDKKAKERGLTILSLIKALCDRNFEEAYQMWKTQSRKVKRWPYPYVEEAVLLIEENLEAVK